MPFFICPNCKNRSIDHDGKQGLLQQAVSCERCVALGFGLGEDGRKLYAGTVLLGEAGDVLAVARQTWIAPKSA